MNPIAVFILAGQSNMVGGNAISTLPPQWDTVQADIQYAYCLPDIFIPQESAWEPLRPLSGVGSTFSVELVAGRRWADAASIPVAIIKFADNGSSMSQWLNGTLLDDMTAYVDTRLADLVADGFDPVMSGFVWWQGSSDTGVTAPLYADNLIALQQRVEGAYGSMPFMQVQQHIDTATTDGCPEAGGLSTVRQAKIDSGWLLVDIDDMELRDCWHADAAAVVMAGERLASVRMSADITGDGTVGINDFLGILAGWGIGGPDSTLDGFTGIDDFLLVLANWG